MRYMLLFFVVGHIGGMIACGQSLPKRHDVDFYRRLSYPSAVSEARDCDVVDCRMTEEGLVSILGYKVRRHWNPFSSIAGHLNFYDVRFDPKTERVLSERELLPRHLEGRVTRTFASYEPRVVWLGDSVVCSYCSKTEGVRLWNDIGGVAYRLPNERLPLPTTFMYIMPIGTSVNRPALVFPMRNFGHMISFSLGPREEMCQRSLEMQSADGTRWKIDQNALPDELWGRWARFARGTFYNHVGFDEATNRIFFVLEKRYTVNATPEDLLGELWSYDLRSREVKACIPPLTVDGIPPRLSSRQLGKQRSELMAITLKAEPTGGLHRLYHLHAVYDERFQPLGYAFCVQTPIKCQWFWLPAELGVVFGQPYDAQKLLFVFGEKVYLFTIGYIVRIDLPARSCTVLYSREAPSKAYMEDGRTFPLREAEQGDDDGI